MVVRPGEDIKAQDFNVHDRDIDYLRWGKAGGIPGGSSGGAVPLKIVKFHGNYLQCVQPDFNDSAGADDDVVLAASVWVTPPYEFCQWHYDGLEIEYRAEPRVEPFLIVSYAATGTQARTASGVTEDLEFAEQLTPPYAAGQIIWCARANLAAIPQAVMDEHPITLRDTNSCGRAWARVS